LFLYADDSMEGQSGISFDGGPLTEPDKGSLVNIFFHRGLEYCLIS